MIVPATRRWPSHNTMAALINSGSNAANSGIGELFFVNTTHQFTPVSKK
jgi:hypothetical protein